MSRNISQCYVHIQAHKACKLIAAQPRESALSIIHANCVIAGARGVIRHSMRQSLAEWLIRFFHRDLFASFRTVSIYLDTLQSTLQIQFEQCLEQAVRMTKSNKVWTLRKTTLKTLGMFQNVQGPGLFVSAVIFVSRHLIWEPMSNQLTDPIDPLKQEQSLLSSSRPAWSMYRICLLNHLGQFLQVRSWLLRKFRNIPMPWWVVWLGIKSRSTD